ncbi:MAG: hypothetical protein KatS3mg111_3403 [Pirellulaceae bacterium]|nr:MAG: hypothetical protein KatS3mg111_3403 [Pirellulaceae bacterium]
MTSPSFSPPNDSPMLLGSLSRRLCGAGLCNGAVIRMVASLLVAAAIHGAAERTLAQPPWHGYFAAEVESLEHATDHELEAVTPENWPAIRQRWRQELTVMLGLDHWLHRPRTDLQATIVGTNTLDTIAVERLHFQSLPGIYVTANFYRPLGNPPPEGWPAVVYVCGHARVVDHGRLLGNKTSYQHHGLWLARHGVACLMIDTIQLGEFHGEHHGTYRLGRWDWIARGYTPAGVETWNTIRAIDLLCSRTDIDAQRIGITGRSGGGAYTWFAAALDDRVQVAVPVAGITDLRNHVLDGCVEGHCDCMYFVNYYGWDYGKLAALVAPRPLLLENTDRDRIFPLDGVLRIDRQLRRLYAALGASDNYGLVITPGPHADSQSLRVPAFAWLLRHLGVATELIEPPARKELVPAVLQVFTHQMPVDERVGSVGNWFTEMPFLPPQTAGTALHRFGELVAPTLLDWRLLPEHTVAPKMAITAHGQWEEWSWQWQEESASSTPLRLLLLTPRSTDQSEEVFIHLVLQTDAPIDRSAEAWRQEKAILARLNLDAAARHVFVFWRGANWFSQCQDARERQHLARRFYLLGKMPESVATTDLMRAVTWCAAQMPSRDFYLLGVGREQVPAILAALMLRRETPAIRCRPLVAFPAPSDPLLLASIPGLWRLTSWRALSAAALESTIDGKRIGIAGMPPLGPSLLVEPGSQPQQATGLRIVEVTSTSAQVWVRATQWPLPNLADLPAVEFVEPGNSSGPKDRRLVMPDQGIAGVQYAVPGTTAEGRVAYRRSGATNWKFTAWQPLVASSDFSGLFLLEGLDPATAYTVRTEVRAIGGKGPSSTVAGSFRTLPPETAATNFRLAVGTSPAFEDRDGPFGFDVYRTMQARDTDAFILVGGGVHHTHWVPQRDWLLYDWQRTYGLPTLVDFHRHVPTFFVSHAAPAIQAGRSWASRHRADDDRALEISQLIFRQQTGIPDPPYRTVRVGPSLQIWLLEGYRSPGHVPNASRATDGEGDHRAWLERTLDESTATFRVIVTPTPIIGLAKPNQPGDDTDRGTASEREQVRRLLASHDHTIVVCGQRQWQYHRVDAVTGLHEFSPGPSSDRHAERWDDEAVPADACRFLRSGGGYLEIELPPADLASPRLLVRHLDTLGNLLHEQSFPAE